MATFKPYTYFQCPCSESSLPSHSIDQDEEPPSPTSDTEQTFDPRAPRANYSLYPLEHLSYCEDCHQIRCPRCVLDEIVTWYCPNCLFEVPSSTVKSEGNRCTRSCFQCPICIAPLSVSSLEKPPSGLGAEYAPQTGPYVLNCGYCNWSSKEIGIQFDKPNGIFAQLAKTKNGGEVNITAKERRRERKRESSITDTTEEDGKEDKDTEKIILDPYEKLDAESQYENLKAFYQAQLADSAPVSALGFSSDYNYGSPGALSRIMGLYTGNSFTSAQSKSKSSVMREASSALEGLQISSLSAHSTIQQLQTSGYENTPTSSQRLEQSPHKPPKHLSALRPIAHLLRTKRSKRCKTCRHILSKPESKVQTPRFKIRLVALNYIPSITIKPLSPPLPTSSAVLRPYKPVQYSLTFKNPLFETVKVNIATPAHTPGKVRSKVTVLCPQFEVGANTDVWDEALRDGGSSGTAGRGEKRRTKNEISEGQAQAEAGKVWERGRNWTSVVVEVVPGGLRGEGVGELGEDEDVLEIPVFVRVEWEVDGLGDEGGLGGTNTGRKGEGEGRERRELAYWCVLGVGRIAGE